MNKYSKKFYVSVILGIIIWGFFFFILPVEFKNELSLSTKCFIICSYLLLFLGFYFSPVISFKNSKEINRFQKNIQNHSILIIKIIISLILISFAFRYIDLFLNRDLTFSNPIQVNKQIASNSENFSLIFGLASMFRVVYFVPLIFYYGLKVKNKQLLLMCFALFLMPFLEGYLRDSRRIFFESFLLMSIILLFFNKINLKLGKTYIIILIVISGLLTYSFFVIQGRVSHNIEEFYSKIHKSPYNDFVPLKKGTIKYIESDKNTFLKKVYFSKLHIGQYIIHGVYEMDYMKSELKKHTYGKYNGYLLIKLLNKLNITNLNLNNLNNPTKRNTYITFFGGIYLDFGWFGLAIMLFFGFLQKQFFYLKKDCIVFMPPSIVLFFSNIFLLVMNFIRAQFILTIGVYLILLGLIYLFFKIYVGNYQLTNNKLLNL